jgi:hypothetical protein
LPLNLSQAANSGSNIASSKIEGPDNYDRWLQLLNIATTAEGLTGFTLDPNTAIMDLNLSQKSKLLLILRSSLSVDKRGEIATETCPAVAFLRLKATCEISKSQRKSKYYSELHSLVSTS